ncbi:ATP-binding protein [Bacillus sp. MRMR6]|uniref:ATP-binding protein n=1 Tax=Bacillus sp. MRMR6 TaxID=1928617 RepID=UPI0015898251|nr:ATP-binding protein [Bacillus sp. MRMR6]
MSDSIEQVSYHILIVLLPFIIYQLFIREEKVDRGKINSKLMLISSICLILTMSNPIQDSEGLLFDFRIVPILFMFLYGGVRPGIALIVIMMGNRLLIGGPGLVITIINYTIATLLFLLIIKRIQSYTLVRRILVISILYWVITCTRAITLIKIEHFSFMLIFSFLAWVTLIILIFIVDNLDKQIIYDKHIKSAERLNVVSQIAASVAHEVRNPMTSIKGFLQLIKEEKNLNVNQNKYIDISLSELERAEGVINDYLSLAKPTTTEVHTVLDVTAELHSVLDIITSYTNTRNIKINPSIQEGLLTNGKKSEFKQALLNIMKNGVEAINTHGTLTVTSFKNNNHILIEIKDNGIGMTQKQVEQLGAPYYSTKDKGTGVGLTITYKIIKDMKGKVLVHSQQGIGTVFTIELPEA